MIKSGSAGRIPDPLVSVVVFLLVIAALVAAFLVGGQKAGRLRAVLEETSKKGDLASSMEVNLLAAAAAEESAVMAETDDGSKELADAAQRASAALEVHHPASTHGTWHGSGLRPVQQKEC